MSASSSKEITVDNENQDQKEIITIDGEDQGLLLFYDIKDNIFSEINKFGMLRFMIVIIIIHINVFIYGSLLRSHFTFLRLFVIIILFF